MNNIGKAYDIAKNAHEGQVDKIGCPYIHHPTNVMLYVIDYCKNNNIDYQQMVKLCCIALLHDVIEDTNTNEDYLLTYFTPDVVTSIKSLTHVKGEPYQEYLARVKIDKSAAIVKLADLKHNTEEGRKPVPYTELDKKRHLKYENAIAYLLK